MKLSVRQIVVSGLLGAITVVLGVTRLGFIGPIPPLMVSATILTIPAIIGGILEGPVVGLLVGLIFGLMSWLQAPTEGAPANLWFANPLVAVLPRMFIGVTAALVYRALRRSNEIAALGVAAAVGSLTNTVLVLGMVAVFYWQTLLPVLPFLPPNIIAEIIVAIILVIAIVAAYKGIAVRGKTGSSV